MVSPNSHSKILNNIASGRFFSEGNEEKNLLREVLSCVKLSTNNFLLARNASKSCA